MRAPVFAALIVATLIPACTRFKSLDDLQRECRELRAASCEAACDRGVHGLGGCLSAGVLRVSSGNAADQPAALGYYLRACEGGEASACYTSAGWLNDGKGAPADPPRALGLYTDACNRGHALSCSRLGWQYLRQKPPDVAEAEKFFRLACSAEQKPAEACRMPDDLLRAKEEAQLAPPPGSASGSAAPPPGTSKEPKIRLGTLAVTSGGLPNDSARMTIERGVGRYFFCYERALKKTPTLTGSAQLELTVEPRGAVSDARTKSTDIRDDDTNACLRKAFQGLGFPAFKGGPATVRVTVLLVQAP